MRYLRRNYINTTVIVNIVFIVFFSILRSIGVIPPVFISLGFIPLGIINLIVAFVYRNNYYIRLRNIDIVMLFITAYGIISTIFAYNQQVALFGNELRYEGLISLVYYLTIFHLTSLIKKDKELIIYLFILLGCVYSSIGIIQKLGIGGFINKHVNNTYYAVGFTTNPNFFSSFLLLCISYTMGLFIKEKDIFIKVMLGLASSLIFVGMLTTDTVSGMVGLFISLLVLLIYCIKDKKLISYGLIVLLLTSAFFIISYTTKLTVLNNKLIKTANESASIATGNVDDSFGTRRIYVWRRVIVEVPKHWAYGIGIDNVRYIYNGEPIMSAKNLGFDKVHNEYLQILITEGVFALISYLVFYFMVLKKGIRNVSKNNKYYLLIPVVGYLAQAFFNISVIEVAPFFYISMGLLYSKE